MIDPRFYKQLGPISLNEILDGLDVDILKGQFGDIEIENAAPVQEAGVGDISYFDSKKKQAVLEICGASACFVRPEHAHLVGAHNALAIVSKYPRADFAVALSHLYASHGYGEQEQSEFTDVSIAPGAVIGAHAKIGTGTCIGPNSVIGPGVQIGENCTIGANAVIEFATLGNACVIHNGAMIGGSGFGIALGASGGVDIPHVGTVILGDNVSVGCSTTIDRAMFGDTNIGDGCKFDNLVQIAHNTRVGPNCMFAAQVGIAGSCTIGKGVIMGGKAGVGDHLTIGDGATMAAGSLAMHNIPEDEMWSGIPAMPIRQHMRQLGILRKLASKKKPT